MSDETPPSEAPPTETTVPLPPWEEQAFKDEVLAAGFPGSPSADSAFLAALHKFRGGSTETAPPPAEPSGS